MANTMDTRRVMVTGLGMVSALGIGKELFWDGLRTGRRAVSPAGGVTGNLPACHSALIPDLDLAELLPGVKIGRGLTPANRYVLAAAGLALADAGLDAAEREDVGIVLTTLFGAHLLHPRDAEALLGLPSFFVNSLPNMPAGYVSVALGLQGAQVVLTAGAEASGLNAVLYGCDLIRTGSAEAVLAGGYEVLSYGLLYGLRLTARLAVDGEVSVPFHRRRAGAAVGEGCGLLLLESQRHAQQRGARIYAEIKGGTSVQSTGDRPAAVGLAAGQALGAAGVEAEALGAVVAGASGDPAGDRAEAAGLALALGEALNRTLVTAPKAALGECYAASGALAAIVAALAIVHGCLPPIAGCDEPDPACGLQALVVGQPAALNGLVLVSAFSKQCASAAVVGPS